MVLSDPYLFDGYFYYECHLPRPKETDNLAEISHEFAVNWFLGYSGEIIY